MANYKISLLSEHHADVVLNLNKKDTLERLEYSPFEIATAHVYNDETYLFRIESDSHEQYMIENMFINDEVVEHWTQPNLYFKECFGMIKIEVIINSERYVTSSISVMMVKNIVNNNIVNMVNYIYENYETFFKDYETSIHSKLSLLKEIKQNYIKCFHYFKNCAQTKLINVYKIGDFSELKTVEANTVRYISEHPEELKMVNYNSGILYNKQYYVPQNTLISSVAYSNDIYENQIVVSFLKTIVKELNDMKKHIISLKSQYPLPKEKEGYIESVFFIYNESIKKLNRHLKHIEGLLSEFQKIYRTYQSVFAVKEISISSPPRFTNIFCNIMPYRIIYENILNWYHSKSCNEIQKELVLHFVSISKIYEYYCLLKICKSIRELGFALQDAYSYKYAERKFYTNTTYYNTVIFKKEDREITLYFQPIIYGKYQGERPNGIDLYRNTSISIDIGTFFLSNQTDYLKGNFYTPDFLLKIKKGSHFSYYIIDAKHSYSSTIKRYQLPFLIYKYLFSISTIYEADELEGVCFLCGKEENNSISNVYDIAQEQRKIIKPSANIVTLTGSDVSNNFVIRELLATYIYT